MTDSSSPPAVAPEGPPSQTQLAIERTLLAHENTLMAWERTSLSMITLGFSVYRLAVFLRERDPEWLGHQQIVEARLYSSLFILMAVISLAAALWQHTRQIRQLRVHAPDAPRSLAVIVGIGVLLLGAWALLAAQSLW